jgi:hypothetical protein
VDREGEHRLVAGEDRGGAVALVHVAIDDRDPLQARFALHGAGGDRGVVEDAEALAPVAEGMVRAAGEIRRPPPRQRLARRGQGRAARSPRSLHHALRPGKSDRADLRLAERAGNHSPQVLWTMCARDLRVARGFGHAEVVIHKLTRSEQARAQPLILPHREAMLRRQRKDENVAIKQCHRTA